MSFANVRMSALFAVPGGPIRTACSPAIVAIKSSRMTSSFPRKRLSSVCAICARRVVSGYDGCAATDMWAARLARLASPLPRLLDVGEQHHPLGCDRSDQTPELKLLNHLLSDDDGDRAVGCMHAI